MGNVKVSGQWLAAGLLSIIAELSSTLATFLPMKSVFILAAEGVPAFFPNFLVSSGPLIAAMFLLGLAAIFAGLTALSKGLSAGLATPEAGLPGAYRVARFSIGEFSLFGLAAILVSVSALFSIAFTALVVGWIVASWAALFWVTHRRAPLPPFGNSNAEFKSKFKKWMVASALWATVGAAIITLLLVPPEFGLTAILLNSVLLMRLQRAVGELVSLLNSVGSDTANQLRLKNQKRAWELYPPIDYLATEVGQKHLRASLQANGLALSDWRIVGRANRVQGTLFSKDENSQRWLMVRIFAVDETAARDIELSRRLELSEPALGVLSASTNKQATVAGLPAIITDWTDLSFLPNDSITTEDVVAWQLSLEEKCLTNEVIQAILARSEMADPADFLLPQLRQLINFRGPQRKPMLEVIEKIETVRRIYLSGGRTYGLSGSSGTWNFIKLQGEQIEPIDLTRLEVGPIGSFWSDSPALARQLLGAKGQKKSFAGLPAHAGAELRAFVGSLTRACQGRDFAAMGLHAEQILAFLEANAKPKVSY